MGQTEEKKSIRFSVIITVYNKEMTVGKAIDSVLQQTYQDFELLIIDDESTDNSVAIIKRYFAQKIRFFRKENHGVSAARNFGIEHAVNDWIAFLDADDYWKPNHLETLASLHQLHPDIQFLASEFLYSTDPIGIHNNKVLSDSYQESAPVLINESAYYSIPDPTVVSTITVCINKYCFKEVGLYLVGVNSQEDGELYTRIIERFDLLKSPIVTAIYNREHNIKHLTDDDVTFDYYYALSYHLTLQPFRNTPRAVNDYLRVLEAMRYYHRKGEVDNIRKNWQHHGLRLLCIPLRIVGHHMKYYFHKYIFRQNGQVSRDIAIRT